MADPASLAVTAALTAANMAVTASRTIEGPRLSDTSATVADYGTPLNYFVGQRVLVCPCFFAKPIREVRKKRKGKGGKQVQYTGFATWASHIADHEIAGVGKIWFDNHLVYDASADGDEIYPLGEGYELAANMRIYTGTETQMPDPDMQAFIEARDGAGTCPAYRGTSYIYFENIPTELLGNRFPTVTVLARTTTHQKAKFQGWYARARIEILDFVQGAGCYVDPSGTPGRLFSGGPPTGTWPDSANEAFPDGIPYYVIEGDGAQMTFYWCDPAVMDSTEIDLRLQFGFGGASNDTRARFHWQFWNELSGHYLEPKETSTVIAPGSHSWTLGDPFDVESIWPDNWYFGISGDGVPEELDSDFGLDTHSSVEQLLAFVSDRTGIAASARDWSGADELIFAGYNWTQGTGKQVLEPVLDLFDVDVRPHDFGLQALPRGSTTAGALPEAEFAIGSEDAPAFTLTPEADSDLPRRVFLTYADVSADQNPNVAMPSGPTPEAAGTQREMSIDMRTLALMPDVAQQLAERRQRRARFGRIKSQFALTRARIATEPGDVWTPSFGGEPMTMRCLKMTIGADGRLSGEWERDDPAIALLAATPGAAAAGYIPDGVPDSAPSLGLVMDLPLLIDAQDQSAPMVCLAAGPAEPGTWMGADFAMSDTGELDSYTEAWDGIAPADGATIGTCGAALPAALPWVPDMASSVSIEINAGELTAATLDELLANPALNLAAIESGDGWELVQFMTPTLTAERTYTISGFLRGMRGTEWAIGGHAADDRFVLLDSAAKVRTLGASEIGDTDWYIVSATGQEPDQTEAFSLSFTGASHKPYSPVHGAPAPDGADWTFDAVRRTRIGGATLDGQDVPLGEASESWLLDIMDGTSVIRTIAGTSLPLTYAEADQITDWGSALTARPEANLYQVDPTLNLRGYPLNFPAG